jgi:hypothetical protein
MHRGAKYEPPISEAEWRQLSELPAAKLGPILEGRQVRLTRIQWLCDSIGYSYFWKSQAKNSLVPTLGVFFACICVGGLERRRARSNVDLQPVVQSPG